MIGRPPALAFAAALLAVPACSSGGSPTANEQDARAGNAAKTVVATSAGPAKVTPAASPGPTAVAAAAKGERRCGWLINPTPGNWWLVDRDGEWILGTQGGEAADGMDEMPDMTTAGWVETNVHYGHGCACMTITYDAATKRVVRVADASPRPLEQCRADKRLPRPE